MLSQLDGVNATMMLAGQRHWRGHQRSRRGHLVDRRGRRDRRDDGGSRPRGAGGVRRGRLPDVGMPLVDAPGARPSALQLDHAPVCWYVDRRRDPALHGRGTALRAASLMCQDAASLHVVRRCVGITRAPHRQVSPAPAFERRWADRQAGVERQARFPERWGCGGDDVLCWRLGKVSFGLYLGTASRLRAATYCWARAPRGLPDARALPGEAARSVPDMRD